MWYSSQGKRDADPCEYVKKLEEDFEGLQAAFFALTSKYARLQFRVSQLVEADPCERESLIRDLDRTAFCDNSTEEESPYQEMQCNNDDMAEFEVPSLQREIRSMGSVRSKQCNIINDLRSQLTVLAVEALNKRSCGRDDDETCDAVSCRPSGCLFKMNTACHCHASPAFSPRRSFQTNSNSNSYNSNQMDSQHMGSPHMSSPHMSSQHMSSQHTGSPHMSSPHMSSPQMGSNNQVSSSYHCSGHNNRRASGGGNDGSNNVRGCFSNDDVCSVIRKQDSAVWESAMSDDQTLEDCCSSTDDDEGQPNSRKKKTISAYNAAVAAAATEHKGGGRSFRKLRSRRPTMAQVNACIAATNSRSKSCANVAQNVCHIKHPTASFPWDNHESYKTNSAI